MSRFLLSACCVIVLGCDGHREKDDNSAPAGLLMNSTVQVTERGLISDWMLVQHAGAKSYEVTSEVGVISFARTGSEPWGKLRQVFRGADGRSIQGKVMEFSAEVSGDFSGLYGRPVGPTGLGVLIKGKPAGANPMFGPVVLFKKTVPVAPPVGNVPWQRYTVAFDVPALEAAGFIEVELFFLMTYGGVMHVRDPALNEQK